MDQLKEEGQNLRHWKLCHDKIEKYAGESKTVSCSWSIVKITILFKALHRFNITTYTINIILILVEDHKMGIILGTGTMSFIVGLLDSISNMRRKSGN